jgi:hypothetical protein
MADQQQLVEMLDRINATLGQHGVMLTTLATQAATVDASMTQQAVVMTMLATQAATTDARFASGEAGVQTLVAQLETRLNASEASMAAAMVTLNTGLEQRLAAMEKLVTTMAAAAARTAAPAAGTTPAAHVFQGVAAQPSTGGPSSSPAAVATATPSGSANAPSFDPWAGAKLGAPPGMPAPMGGAQHFQLHGTEGLKAKDFMSVQVFNGDLNTFADWADRMSSKLARGHPQLATMLSWAERREEPITLTHELEVAALEGIDVVGISGAIFDVMMERTGPRTYDKRSVAGKGRGLEFWRILKRDYGTESANAQLAKQRVYSHPARCASMPLLGDALDKWEALGRDIHCPIPENFHLIALQNLVPKSLAETMAAQPSLTKFSEALAFVRRQVADHRHATQVQIVQRQAPVAMDVSSLAAAFACWQNEPVDEQEYEPETSQLEQFIAAFHGKGKGAPKGKGRGENRECYNCGVAGHLAAACPAPPKAKGDPKGDAKGGKGKSKGKGGKGKGWDVHALTEDDGEAFSLGCLMRAEETPVGAVTTQQPEVWQDYEVVEAMMDSGAGECVCGPQHFSGIDMTVNPDRASARTEYITADGGRIRNQGEKLVPGLSDEGASMNINFQVTQVETPLIAVSKLTAVGHQVWFGGDHGYITHGSSGKHTKFFKKKGVFVLRIWVPRARPASAAALSGGMRQ